MSIGEILNFIIGSGVCFLVLIFPPPNTITSIFPLKGKLYEAKYYKQIDLGVQCELCPFNCYLPEGERGRCRVRINLGNKLYTLVYGEIAAAHIDPIEKKPVFHMLPGTGAFSIATAGCNLRCQFCQNWEISQKRPEEVKSEFHSPEEVVLAAIRTGCRSIAYTYSEPIIFFEYVLDTAKLAKKYGLKNILVSGGLINPKPLKELIPYFDVIKIDLKGFNENFYEKVVGTKLEFILNTLIELKKLNVLVEVVNLVVPTLNDNMEEIEKMCKWIYENLGADTPVFFSRFYPQYKLKNLPETPVETLEKARNIAMKVGLNYVYIGNVPGHPGENTYCPKCKNVVIRRYGYRILEYNIDENGNCKFCGYHIHGIWK
jgi:pyruvate formate lyase activating enzyme